MDKKEALKQIKAGDFSLADADEKVKKKGTPDAAKKEVEKMIKSKLKKGYKKK